MVDIMELPEAGEGTPQTSPPQAQTESSSTNSQTTRSNGIAASVTLRMANASQTNSFLSHILNQEVVMDGPLKGNIAISTDKISEGDIPGLFAKGWRRYLNHFVLLETMHPDVKVSLGGNEAEAISLKDAIVGVRKGALKLSTEDDSAYGSIPESAPPLKRQRNERKGRDRRAIGANGRTKRQPNGDTKFRRGKPVLAEIPYDVFVTVMSFMSPKYLRQARLVCRMFNDYLLRYPKIWETSRLNYFGPNMPKPPGGMSELRFNVLLFDDQCHGCGERPTIKIFWAWRAKWCSKCREENTIKQEAAEAMIGYHFRNIQICLWGGKFKGQTYKGIDKVNPREPVWRSRHVQTKVYYRIKDVEALKAEYEDFITVPAGEAEKTRQEISEWQQARGLRDIDTVNEISDMEDFMDHYAESIKSRNKDYRQLRKEFFLAKAAELKLTEEDMSKVDAYRRSIKISRKPSEKAWTLLAESIYESYPAAFKEVPPKVANRSPQTKVYLDIPPNFGEPIPSPLSTGTAGLPLSSNGLSIEDSGPTPDMLFASFST